MSQIFKLKNGTLFLLTEAPGGIYNSAQLKKIAELCNQDLAIVKATEDQRIGLFVKEQEVDAICEGLQSVGLGVRNYQQGLHQPVSCIGELCEEHEQDALGSSMDITREIADIQLSSPIKIGINGCARCCTPCHTLDISVIGEALGYRISLGGKGSQIPELASFMAEGVPPGKLPAMIKKLVQIYHQHAGPGENLLEVIDRCGVSEFVAALAPYSQDAAHADDPLAVAKDLVAADTGVEEEEQLSLDDDIDDIASLDSLAEDFNESEGDLSSEGEGHEITEDEELSWDDSNKLSDEDDLSDVSMDSSLDEDLSPLEESVSEDKLADDDLHLDDGQLNDLEEIPIRAKPSSDIKSEADSTSDDPLQDEELASEDDDEVFSSEDFDFDDSDLEALPTEDDHSLEEDLTEEEKTLLNSYDDDLNPDTKMDHKPQAASSESASNPTADEDPLAEDFGDAEGLSEEDELDFEQRLNESIDEEAKLIASEEKDVNEDERQATLGMLESGDLTALSSTKGEFDQESLKDIDESALEGLAEEDLQPITDDSLVETDLSPIESPEVVAPQAASLPVAKPARQSKANGSTISQYFKFSGMDLIDQDKMHLSFESGAFIDIDLSSLTVGEEKAFSLGGQSFVFVHTAEGYLLEVEGVRLFYPHSDLQQAS
ncbi:MAG: hypothetical protein ACOH5I_19370 [Oligoflexus sp.]